MEDIRRIYAQAELDMITRITNKLERGKTLTLSQWERAKLNELRQLTNGINQQVIPHLVKKNEDKLDNLIRLAYQQGSDSAVKDLTKIKDNKAIKSEFLKSDTESIRLLTSELNQSLSQTHLRILRQSQDYYQQAVAKGSNYVLTGAGTRLEGAQKTLNQLANKGITGFVDKGGRNWNLSSYVEMATRTATGRARIDGNINRFATNGEDLVIVSGHYESCPICDPWEARILSISGKNPDYASVQDAKNAGLFHPNCTHNLTLYVEGLTDPEKLIKQKKGSNLYEERQQQRYNERMIRKWKRRKAASLTDSETKKVQSYVSKWEKKQSDFIGKTGRIRKYDREEVDEAR